MKKFLIFVFGLVIGGLVVYFFFPNTVRSQKSATECSEIVDSLVQEGVSESPKKREPATKSKQPGQTAQPAQNSGKTYFENAVEYSGRKAFQVQKVLDNGDAFAEEVNYISSGTVITDFQANVLLERDPEMPYYDRQLVQATSGKKVMQVGIYRYKSGIYSDDAKTIPIISVR